MEGKQQDQYGNRYLQMSNYPKLDANQLKAIYAKMSDHLPIKFDLFEMNLREIGYRTKRYFL